MKEKALRDKDFLQAALVQKNILTHEDYIQQLDGLEIENIFLPMNNQVSGDYYNISQTAQGSTSIFIADATGHGTQAALTTMQIDLLYRESLMLKHPDERLNYINKIFISEIQGKNYFTAIALEFHENEVQYSSAGHPEQYLIQPAKQEIHPLYTRGGIIGLLENRTYKMATARVEKGDILLLFTDGVYEVFNENREEFGEKRFLALLQAGLQNGLFEKPIKEIINSIIEHLNTYKNNEPFIDDITLLGIRVLE